MNVTSILLNAINGYKTYSGAFLMVAAGISAIVAKNYGQGANDVLQALTLLGAGTTVVGLRHAVAKVPSAVLDAAKQHP